MMMMTTMRRRNTRRSIITTTAAGTMTMSKAGGREADRQRQEGVVFLNLSKFVLFCIALLLANVWCDHELNVFAYKFTLC